MKSKKRAVLDVLLSTSLYLVDNLPERTPDNVHEKKAETGHRERSRSYGI
jgi:hypothetical protein